MEDGVFKQGDLKLVDWQHTVRHTRVDAFVCGEKVFLKSAPEHPMTVYSVNEKSITVMWRNRYNEIQLFDFPPECILQYKYASLLTYRRKFCVSFN